MDITNTSLMLNRLMAEGRKTPDNADTSVIDERVHVGAIIGENSRLNSENQRLAAENERLAMEVQRLANTSGTSASSGSVHGVSIGNADYCELLAIPPERMHDFDHDLEELLRWMYGSKPYPERYHHASEGDEFNKRVEYGLVTRLRSMLAKYGVHYGNFNDEVCINDGRFIDRGLSDVDRLVGLASHWRGEINCYKVLNQHRVYLAVQTVIGLVKWRNVC
ncbi:hypothetical protein BDZ91DRAFT_738271, partial [Kalaharituber pfeilii]